MNVLSAEFSRDLADLANCCDPNDKVLLRLVIDDIEGGTAEDPIAGVDDPRVGEDQQNAIKYLQGRYMKTGDVLQ